MRKFFIVSFIVSIVLTSSFITAHGQEAKHRKNEISLELYHLIHLVPKITYERIISPSFGVGGEALYAFGSTGVFTAFGRYYPEKKKYGSGLFPEIFGYYAMLSDNQVAGAGVGVGYKYLLKDKWIGEIHIGPGYNFLTNDNSEKFHFRWGLNIGYRF